MDRPGDSPLHGGFNAVESQRYVEQSRLVRSTGFKPRWLRIHAHQVCGNQWKSIDINSLTFVNTFDATNPSKSEHIRVKYICEREKKVLGKYFFNFSIIFWKKIRESRKIFMRVTSNVLNFARGYFNKMWNVI